jgi:putative flippase GtrA
MLVHSSEVVRYGINGVVATSVHYAVLVFNINVLGMESAGTSNLIAAIFGISTSFLGNRLFVFPGRARTWRAQLLRFGRLYLVIAVFHGTALWVWSDVANLDYRSGFLIATAVQTILSYLGNKHWVFSA